MPLVGASVSQLQMKMKSLNGFEMVQGLQSCKTTPVAAKAILLCRISHVNLLPLFLIPPQYAQICPGVLPSTLGKLNDSSLMGNVSCHGTDEPTKAAATGVGAAAGAACAATAGTGAPSWHGQRTAKSVRLSSLKMLKFSKLRDFHFTNFTLPRLHGEVASPHHVGAIHKVSSCCSIE